MRDPRLLAELKRERRRERNRRQHGNRSGHVYHERPLVLMGTYRDPWKKAR